MNKVENRRGERKFHDIFLQIPSQYIWLYKIEKVRNLDETRFIHNENILIIDVCFIL